MWVSTLPCPRSASVGRSTALASLGLPGSWAETVERATDALRGLGRAETPPW